MWVRILALCKKKKKKITVRHLRVMTWLWPGPLRVSEIQDRNTCYKEGFFSVDSLLSCSPMSFYLPIYIPFPVVTFSTSGPVVMSTSLWYFRTCCHVYLSLVLQDVLSCLPLSGTSGRVVMSTSLCFSLHIYLFIVSFFFYLSLNVSGENNPFYKY